MPNISETKGNQAMKFGQVIEYSVRNIFLENHGDEGTGGADRGDGDRGTSFSRKLNVKTRGQHLSFNIFW